MPIDTTLPSIASEARTWRHDFHAHPETAFEEVRTSSLVAERLRAFGVDHVETGVAGTGVVGVIEGHLPGPGRRIALRADMDALPIEELGDIPYRSTIQGRMHACGHDGHTAMLLGAAKHLAATRAFSGTVVLVFQPAEESGFVGAKRMIEAGLLERYPVEQIFALHNWPGLPVGTIAIRRGAVMAAFDTFSVRIRGKGAHASKPHRSIDPLVTGAHLVSALQSIVSRSVDPFQMAVVSVCTLRGGDINNVIPHTAEITGSVRTYARETQSTIADRIVEISKGIGQAFGAAVEAAYERCQPRSWRAPPLVAPALR
jgi:amidohydrolase